MTALGLLIQTGPQDRNIHVILNSKVISIKQLLLAFAIVLADPKSYFPFPQPLEYLKTEGKTQVKIKATVQQVGLDQYQNLEENWVGTDLVSTLTTEDTCSYSATLTV